VYRDGELLWQGVSLARLAEEIETPFFLISERQIVNNCRELKAALPAATLRYCAKTNNELSVLRPIAAEGMGVLASHLAEVEAALEAGFAPERIAFQRPIAVESEIREVLRRGVRFVHVLREGDVAMFESVAASLGIAVEVSIRLRQRIGLLSAAGDRLGCDGGEAQAVAARIRRSPHLRLAALNLYLGTQQERPAAFDHALARVLPLARRLRQDALEINLGGGIPAASTSKLSPGSLLRRARGLNPAVGISLREFAAALARSWDRSTRGETGLTLALEPGRSIVADAGVLLTRIVARQRQWLFLDASRNHSGEAPLMFNRAVLPVREVAGPARSFGLSGSTLNTLDVIDARRSLPESIREGDALALMDAGAYSISRASRYAGLTPPVYLLGESGTVRIARRGETPEDLLGPMRAGA
jgi:diaminopimelate decarboxylase